MNDTLFRVKTTWVHEGRIVSTDCVVAAPDAVAVLTRELGGVEDPNSDAVEAFFHECDEIENPQQLRKVEIEWLCPVDCVRNLKRD